MKTSVLSWVVICFLCFGVNLQAQKSKSSTTGRFGLKLDGKYLGNVDSVSGGTTSAKTSQSSVRAVRKTNTSTATTLPTVLEVDLGLKAGFYDWIKETLKEEADPRNLELLALDTRDNIVTTRQRNEATITNVTFPTLDASSKENAYLSVTVHSDQIQYGKGSGTVESTATTKSKSFVAYNFRVEIARLPCKGVTKIESFSWNMPIVKSNVASRSKSLLTRGKPETSNLKLNLSMRDHEAWMDWCKVFVYTGNTGADKKLSGSITFLGFKTELASGELYDIGCAGLEIGKLKANAAGVKTFDVELSVGSIVFRK